MHVVLENTQQELLGDNIYYHEQELLKKRNIKVISSYVKTHRHSNLKDMISENCLLNKKK